MVSGVYQPLFNFAIYVNFALDVQTNSKISSLSLTYIKLFRRDMTVEELSEFIDLGIVRILFFFHLIFIFQAIYSFLFFHAFSRLNHFLKFLALLYFCFLHFLPWPLRSFWKILFCIDWVWVISRAHLCYTKGFCEKPLRVIWSRFSQKLT